MSIFGMGRKFLKLDFRFERKGCMLGKKISQVISTVGRWSLR